MLHKSFELLETKADGDTGEFTALVSTFGNVDKVGDRIVMGAYAKTLAKWRKSGDPLPIILAHQWDDVMAHVGYADANDIEETPKGLVVKGTLDVKDNPVARQVHKLMKRRTLKEFSIGYSVPQGGEKRAKDGANEITEIELAECGPCLMGIDPKTELHSVKSALGIEEPKSAQQLREDATRTARELEESKLPQLPEQPEPKADEPTRDDLAAELAEVKARLAEVEKRETPTLTPEQLREEAAKAAREVEQTKLPQDIPPAADVKSDEPDMPDVANELQEVKDRLSELEKRLEDLSSKTDETAKGTKSRAVDPQRQQADRVALEVASGGLRPVKTEPAPMPAEPTLPLKELKRRARDEMLSILSGGTTQ